MKFNIKLKYCCISVNCMLFADPAAVIAPGCCSWQLQFLWQRRLLLPWMLFLWQLRFLWRRRLLLPWMLFCGSAVPVAAVVASVDAVPVASLPDALAARYLLLRGCRSCDEALLPQLLLLRAAVPAAVVAPVDAVPVAGAGRHCPPLAAHYPLLLWPVCAVHTIRTKRQD